MTFIQNIIFSALFRSYSVQGLEIFTQTGHNKYVHTKEKDSLFGCLENKDPKDPLRPQYLKTKTPPYFWGLQNYDQPVANAID